MSTPITRSVLIVLMSLWLGACATTGSGEPTDTVVGSSTESAASSSDVEAAAVSIADSSDTYKLAQGDKISIQVFDEPDLTMNQTVSGRGVINYSYLGDVQVAGKTPSELEAYITGLLENGFLVNPSVNVSIVEFRPFFIGGEVRSPGSYPYQPGLTLDKAIALAGGLTDRASSRQMFVIRAKSGQGQQKISLGDTVNPGDTITIKEGFF